MRAACTSGGRRSPFRLLGRCNRSRSAAFSHFWHTLRNVYRRNSHKMVSVTCLLSFFLVGRTRLRGWDCQLLYDIAYEIFTRALSTFERVCNTRIVSLGYISVTSMNVLASTAMNVHETEAYLGWALNVCRSHWLLYNLQQIILYCFTHRANHFRRWC